MFSGPFGDRPCPVPGRPELRDRPVRLFEVVADDLVELLPPAVEPASDSLVQLGANLLGNAFVGRVPDQHVPEVEGVLDRLVRADELLADERRELRAGRPPPVGSQLAEGLPFELEPDDRRALEQVALLIGQRVETSGEKHLDRRWHVLRGPALSEHREQLLDEQRIPFGRCADPSTGVLLEPRVAEKLLDQLIGLSLGKRIERNRQAAPTRTLVEQLGPRKAEEQKRRVPRPVSEMLDQIEECRLGPVNTFEHEYERLLARATFERFANRPEDLFGRSLPKRRVEVALPPSGREDLTQRPVGDSFAVGQATAAQHVCFATQIRRELATEARLPNARRAEHRYEPAATYRDGLVKGTPYARELVAPSNERHIATSFWR